MGQGLISIRNLSVEYRSGSKLRVIKALDNVSIEVEGGEIVAIVGESGSGKSTLGRAVLGLAPISKGNILIDGQNLANARQADRRQRARIIQCIFQDPYSSLNPHFNVASILAEPLIIHRSIVGNGSEQVDAVMKAVGLSADLKGRRPRELSGGQCQRVAIARAMMLEPKLIVCDEPTSSLDVSVQAQIIELLLDLRSKRGVSLLFISHDLAVVSQIADRVIVMFRGKIVEQGRPAEIYGSPRHPYTAALLSAAPIADPIHERTRKRLKVVDSREEETGSGCPYRGQCWLWRDLGEPSICASVAPTLLAAGGNANAADCHFSEMVVKSIDYPV